MKKKKEKWFCFVMILLLSVYSGSTEEILASGDEGIAQIVMLIPTMGQEPEDLQLVEDAINEISEKKAGVSVDIQTVTTANYQQQVMMRLHNGESPDIVAVSGIDYSEAIARKQILELDDLLETYGKDILENVPEFYLNLCRQNGYLYSIPAVQGAVQQPILLIRKDIASAVGYEMEDLQQIESWQDLESLLLAVQEEYPDFIPFSPVITSISSPSRTTVDGLFEEEYVMDELGDCIGVMIKDSDQVVNYWGTEMFRQECEVMHEWYEKGLIWKDGVTSSVTAIDRYLFSEDLFCFGFSSTVSSDKAWEQPSNELFLNAPTVNLPIGEPYVDGSVIRDSGVVIPVESQNPTAAMKFLNLLYSDAEVTNLLFYGIEGIHYSLNDEGLMLETEQYSSYSNSFSNSVGNQFFAQNWAYNGEDYCQKLIEMTLDAKKSNALGFYPNMEDYSEEITAIKQVCTKYLGGLMLGAVDPDTELPKFLEELEEAGIEDIIREKQKQYDSFQS